MPLVPIYVLISILSFYVALPADEAPPSGLRYALLIGNWNYDGLKLEGANKSLDLLEKALKEKQFSVLKKENLKQKELKATAEEFVTSLPTNSIGFIYYYGLGANLERQKRIYNILRPVDLQAKNENDYRSKGVRLEDLLKTLKEKSGARHTILFFDCAWDSPLKPETDNIQNGFTETEVPPGAMVGFVSTQDAAVPLLKSDQASPFAQAISSQFSDFERSIPQASQKLNQKLKSLKLLGESSSALGEALTNQSVDDPGQAKQAGDLFVNSSGMSFRWCPKGSFTMGSNDHQSPSVQDRKSVAVEITQGFWLGEYEVTQREYQLILRKNVPRGFTIANNAPFWGVGESKQINDFCKKLTDREKKAGRLPKGWEYTCPTEAEWEYACRAGSQSKFSFGDSQGDLSRYGNFADLSLKTENPNFHYADSKVKDGVGESLALVGSYWPNAWGLRDMHGNVAEVVADHYSDVLPGGKNPLKRVQKDGKTIIRGGAWCSMPLYCESSFRNFIPGRNKYNYVGFRIALKKVGGK